MSEIVITNVGAIRELAIPIPEEGGVVVLRGRNETGKSTALGAIQRLVDGDAGDVTLTPHDGQKSGSVTSDILGAKLTVGASTRKSGELEVAQIEGTLDLGDIVDPQIADEEAADRKRIRALVSILKPQMPYQRLKEILGDDYAGCEAVAPSGTTLDKIDAIKRNMEAKAREATTAQEKQNERITVLQSQLDGTVFDETICVNTSESILLHERAVQAASEANSRYVLAVEKVKQWQALGEAIKTDQLQRDREAYQETEEEKHILNNSCIMLQDEIGILEEALVEKKKEYAVQRERLTVMIKERYEIANRIRQQEEVLKKLSDIPDPSVEMQKAASEAEEAKRVVEQQWERHQLNEKMLKAKGTQDAIDAATVNATAYANNAKAYREMAAKVGQLAGEVMASENLGDITVESGRLIVDTPERGKIAFSQMSHGGRIKIALRVLVAAARKASSETGRPAILVCKQEFWEGLDPVNRQEVHNALKGTKVTLLTAECSADSTIQAGIAG